MREFKDNQGKTWKVDMTVSALKRVKARVGWVPGTPGTEAVDVCMMVDTLYAVCVPDTEDMPQDSFDNRLDGCLGEAISALEEETSDFFQRQGLATEETTESDAQASGSSLTN